MAFGKVVNSEQTLCDYVYRALGAPVLQINVEKNQVLDRIHDALDLFWQYHADGLQHQYFKHQLTDDEVKNQCIKLDPSVISVITVLPIDGQDFLAINNLQYVMYITDIMNPQRLTTGNGLSSYTVTMSYLNMVGDLFNSQQAVEFNYAGGTLRMDIDWGEVEAGDYIIIEGYTTVDPNQFPNVWNNYWLRRYAVALVKKQWGWNLLKYANNQLPGNVTINAQTIYDAGVAEVKDLEDELHDKYELPPDFFVG